MPFKLNCAPQISRGTDGREVGGDGCGDDGLFILPSLLVPRLPLPHHSMGIEQRYLGTPRRRLVTMSQEDQARCHPKIPNDGHPQATSLPASALRKNVRRTESSQELSPHQSQKREVTNQRTEFVLACPTQRCDVKHASTEAPKLPARHSDNPLPSEEGR